MQYKAMKNTDHTTQIDAVLRAAKQASQERSYALVSHGARSQESMFLIPPALAKSAKVRHRTTKF